MAFGPLQGAVSRARDGAQLLLAKGSLLGLRARAVQNAKMVWRDRTLERFLSRARCILESRIWTGIGVLVAVLAILRLSNMASVLEELNQTSTPYPGADLRLVYEDLPDDSSEAVEPAVG